MRKLSTLILNQKNATVVCNQGKRYSIDSPDEVYELISGPIVIIINHSDLDIAKIDIPVMSWLDRRRYIDSRKKYHSHAAYNGVSKHKKYLIEFSCPRSENIEYWIESLLQQKIQIKEIRPYIFTPLNQIDDQYNLIITSHEDYLRQSAFLGKIPLFTRTTEISSEDINTTITYLKNQYHPNTIVIGGSLNQTLYNKLSETLSSDSTLEIENLVTDLDFADIHILRHTTTYKFQAPEILEISRKATQVKQSYLAITALCFLMMLSAFYQQYRVNEHSLTTGQLNSLLITQQQKLGAISPDFLVDEKYLNHPNPLKLLGVIASSLPDETRVSNLRWACLEDQVRCEVDICISTDTQEPSERISLLNSFKERVEKNNPEYHVRVESLPFQSASHEVFSGFPNQENLNLEGQAFNAKFIVVAKK